MVHDRKASEDIVQDVFLALWERREEVEFQLSQLSEEIDCCISGLSEQCRRVFLLSRTTGLKNREIAERLNISVKTVEKHIGAALSQLRIRLSRSGFLRLFL